MATKTSAELLAAGWSTIRTNPEVGTAIYKKGTTHGILSNDDCWMPLGTGTSTTKDAVLAYLPVLLGCSMGMSMKGSAIEALFDSLP
jgi:hypothetical protein